jgi:predicted nucleotidyltransferase
MPDETLETLKTLLLEEVPGCLAIYCFGSWGTQDQRPESDIDLAFWAGAPLDPMRRWEVEQQLAVAARRNVDLVDLAMASTVMRMQVVGHGRRLFCADSERVETFEDCIFSSYARLNEERREILVDIHRRGSVYGD